MNNLQLRCSLFLALLFLVICISPVSAGQPQLPAETFHLTGQVYYANIEGGFYGILGDDGIKYQPTNLPRKFRKEGLILKFDGKIKNTSISTFQWGTIIEVSNVNPLLTTVTKEERTAIFLLSKRLEAFNQKDLVKLQQIDLQAQQLTNEQFQGWVSRYHHYTLQYVDISSATSTEITGACYYTRELINGMTLHGTTELAAMDFTLNQTPKGWKVKEIGPLTHSIFSYQEDALSILQKKAMEKYKMNNLETFGQ